MLYSVDNVAKIYHTIYFTFLLGVDIATDEIMINFYQQYSLMIQRLLAGKQTQEFNFYSQNTHPIYHHFFI